MRQNRFLWITDPWSTHHPTHETTLRLIQEGQLLGIESWWADLGGIRVENAQVLIQATQVLEVPAPLHRDSIRLSPPQLKAVSDFDQVHYRPDPPLEYRYLHHLQLLALDSQADRLVNPASVLLTISEKIEGLTLPGLGAPSMVASQWEALKQFGKNEGRTVMKPLNQAGSRGIELLNWKSDSEVERSRAILEKASDGFHRPVILQRYFESIHEGEQRLWFVDGELLAVARRKPQRGDFRINMDAGATVEPATLDSRERTAAEQVGRRLKTLRVRLAAVDLIEGWVTDFNVTSPGLLVEMENVLKRNLARPILESLLQPFGFRAVTCPE